MNEHLTNANFEIYAARYYNNYILDPEEFSDDLKRFVYIKRALSKYNNGKELKERIILNHIIILYNMFGAAPLARMLYLKMPDYYYYLKPFLVYIGCMPKTIENVLENNTVIDTVNIPMDNTIIETLRKL